MILYPLKTCSRFDFNIFHYITLYVNGLGSKQCPNVSLFHMTSPNNLIFFNPFTDGSVNIITLLTHACYAFSLYRKVFARIKSMPCSLKKNGYCKLCNTTSIDI